MHRTCLCLLMLLACADAASREVRLGSANGGGGVATDVADAAPVPKAARKPAQPPARDATPRVRPSVHSDASTDSRTRWHSFLPGMFR
ncbi:MAG TPA: hypothetical protein VIG88_13165 [Lysobacter sp.]